MDVKDLINWSELSRDLAGDRTSISRNRIPKKYQKDVDRLLSYASSWKNNEELTNRSVLLNEIKQKVNEIQ